MEEVENNMFFSLEQTNSDCCESVFKNTKLATSLRIKTDEVLASDMATKKYEAVALSEHIGKTATLMFLDKELCDVHIQSSQDGELQALVTNNLHEANEKEAFSFSDYILNQPFTVSVELGRTQLEISQLTSLCAGDIIPLDKLAGEPCKVLLHDYGLCIALGEVVTIDEYFAIRIVELEPSTNWNEALIENISLILSGDLTPENHKNKVSKTGTVGACCVLGKTEITIRSLLGMGEGTLFELGRLAGTPLDLVFDSSSLPSLKGEVLVIDESFAFRIQTSTESTDFPCDGGGQNISGAECQAEDDEQESKQLIDFLNNTNPEILLNFIQLEHPQFVALVLSVLEPDLAALILSRLPDNLGTEVFRRVVTMDRVNKSMFVKALHTIQQKIQRYSVSMTIATGGVEQAVAILNNTDRSTEKIIIEFLEEEVPDLAECIKERLFVFEDIVMLDDRAIQKVLREVETQDLAKALKSTDDKVHEKILKNMSKRAGDMLKEEIEIMGLVRLMDVEKAQQNIVSIIRRLEESGEIIVARSGEDKLVI